VKWNIVTWYRFRKGGRYDHVQSAPLETLGANNRLFMEGATKLVYKQATEPEYYKLQRGGLCVFGCPENAKQSMEKNFCLQLQTWGNDYYLGAG